MAQQLQSWQREVGLPNVLQVYTDVTIPLKAPDNVIIQQCPLLYRSVEVIDGMVVWCGYSLSD